MKLWAFIIGWLLLLLSIALIALRANQLERARKRLFLSEDDAASPTNASDRSVLGRWLFLAGFRSRLGPPAFVLSTIFLLVLGVGTAHAINESGLIARGMKTIGAFPGGALDILAPLLYGAPWLALGFLAAIPFIIVRSARAERVTAVEQDLPLTLEILSTLAEAGLSFDPALDRLLESQPARRPLGDELRLFRGETRAGRPRVQSFRNLASRLEVTAISTFVSALVQAEQSGAGIAMVLREQANDLRSRRRERALEAATALPVKRLIPLFICFLPGIFVWALGPSFYQLFRFMDVFVRHGGVR